MMIRDLFAIPPTLEEQEWRLTWGWAGRRLRMYAIAAAVGAGLTLIVGALSSLAHAQQYHVVPTPSLTINGQTCPVGAGAGCALPNATSKQFGVIRCGPGTRCLNGVGYSSAETAPGVALTSPAYYVATATSTPAGSDSNAGTLQAPFLTLGKCQTQMRAGSTKTCYVRGGTYALPSGGLVLSSSDNGETWSSYPPDGPNAAILDLGGLGASTAGVTLAGSGETFNGFLITHDIQHFIMMNVAICTNCVVAYNVFDYQGATSGWGIDFSTGASDNFLLAANTFANFASTGANPLLFNSGTITHSVIRDNRFLCNNNNAVILMTSLSGNIIARNYSAGTGNQGGGPPGCGTVSNSAATFLQDNTPGSTAPNLIINNTVDGAQGFDMVAAAGNGTTLGTGEIFSDNDLWALSDPAITFDGNPGGIVRRNKVYSPGSGGFDLGSEQDNCPMSHVSPNLLVANNTIVGTPYMNIALTAASNSVLFGNVGGIGTQSAVPPAYPTFYPAGISIQNRSRDYVLTKTSVTLTNGSPTFTVSGTTGIVQGVGQVISATGFAGGTTVTTLSGSTVTASNNFTGTTGSYTVKFLTCGTTANAALDTTGATIEDNQFTSSDTSALYGLYIEANQTATVTKNIFYPSHTAGIQDLGGNTIPPTNWVDAGTSANVATADAIPDGGQDLLIPASTARYAQTIPLNGSARPLAASAAALNANGVTCLWTALGSAPAPANPNSCQTSFVSPIVTVGTIIGYTFAVTGPNGVTLTDYVHFGVDPSL